MYRLVDFEIVILGQQRDSGVDVLVVQDIIWHIVQCARRPSPGSNYARSA